MKLKKALVGMPSAPSGAEAPPAMDPARFAAGHSDPSPRAPPQPPADPPLPVKIAPGPPSDPPSDSGQHHHQPGTPPEKSAADPLPEPTSGSDEADLTKPDPAKVEPAKVEPAAAPADAAATTATGRGCRERKRRAFPGDSSDDEAARPPRRQKAPKALKPTAVHTHRSSAANGPRPTGASAPVRVVPAREHFDARLADFHKRTFGRTHRVPKFNHAELDLHLVFATVQSLGGYEGVTRDKRWKRVCEALGQDLTTATSAGHSMRKNYEKVLLDFEAHLAEREGTPRVVPDAIDVVANLELANDGNGIEDGDGDERARGSEPASSGSDEGDDDDDDAEVERLRLALRRQKAELEARLREREASLAREAATSGGRGRSRVDHWRGVWLSFGDACPLFDASRARFARSVPDAEEEKPRWAQCQLCAGWRDLGVPPGKAGKKAERQKPRSERQRARLEAAAAATGWRPGERIGGEDAKITSADLRAAAKRSLESRSAPEPVMGAPTPVDALAAAAAAIVADVPPEQAKLPERAIREGGTLDAMAAAAMAGVAEEDRDMFATDEAKSAMNDAMHAVVRAVVTAFAEHREPVGPEDADADAERRETREGDGDGDAAEDGDGAGVASPRPRKLRFVIKRTAVSALGALNAGSSGESTPAADARRGAGTGFGARAAGRDEGVAVPPRPADAPEPPRELCVCVPAIPEGWSRWEALRKKPAANGSWAADCYYRTPAGPDGKWKTFVLRSDEEISQFLRADAAQSDSCFTGLTMEFFMCKPFTRRTLQSSQRAGTKASAARVTHKWRAELAVPEDGTAEMETEDGDALEEENAPGKDVEDEDGDEVEEEEEDAEAAAIAKVEEGPIWY